ncbi:MAG: DNA-directed RNA polymerase I subunit RPA2 [Watsoniomyces obsoletus]|nr:MAG: DNA-directed RNA polymerase I subunit RPA2 [Watsoniomyces obsoletus]
MAPPRDRSTDTHWTADIDAVRREKLFRHPPKDHSAYPALHAAIQPQIDCFNALLEKNGLLEHAVRDIGTKVFLDGESGDPARNRLSIRLKEVFIEKPQLPASNKFSTRNRHIFPAECRERHATYRGRMRAQLEYRVNEDPWKEVVRDLGLIPILLKSNRCHLEKYAPAALVERKEDSEELGGYFIVNGIEKLIRMLIVARRNYPMAIVRSSFVNRGQSYTQYGVSIRSVRPDQTSQTNVLHYLDDGNITFRFSWRKNEYLVPVVMILKALVETNDREIFEGLVGQAGSEIVQNTFLTDRVELLLRTYKAYGLYSRAKTRAYLGEKFKVVLGVPESLSNERAGTEFLRKIVLPHLNSDRSREGQDVNKFQLVLFMIKKLYALVAGDCSADNPDALQNQEILMGGFLYAMILKERLEEWLSSIPTVMRDWFRRNERVKFTAPSFLSDFISKILPRTTENIGKALEYFLSTGNLVSPSGLDLQQTSGFAIVAERINFYRFLSHFRMVHRGAFFAELKTTSVRKLLPESWGFLCPVHTPDGTPCGLLNHLAHTCKVVARSADVSQLPALLVQLGVRPSTSAADDVAVVLDGKIMGWTSPAQAKIVSDTLRYWKVDGRNKVPRELEIGYVPGSRGGQYPGVYLFSQQARMIRPVRYLPLDQLDYVGPFEQPHMSIACTPQEIVSEESTHVEYDPINILSIVANMTPFSDFNQSPRNMYQCQMGKQSMGTPATSLRHRADNKTYLLQTGQTPIVRPPLHHDYAFDHYPNGMNAVVAVISYTGYDMDDAMVINKSAHERGFAHGTVYKTKVIDLEEKGRVKRVTKLFGFAPGGIIKGDWQKQLDVDGLPFIGMKVEDGSIIAASHSVSLDPLTGKFMNRDGQTELHRYRDSETAYVEEVRLLGSENGVEPCTSLSIKFRVPRVPVIGDKFSSRHGQKGVLSQKWPCVDLPFSESGMQPDIIINPHAFPSRMTIGMFIESLAGKSGALHGFAQDSTPFRFDEENTALEYFGHQLQKAGYNYYGNEAMYSGITGEELHAQIYTGVVYYQRLRHMVNDKFQVRTTGPVAPLTGQPIKGRKRGGGIRVGEMERDSLLAHGAAYLLQDRLLNCSDYCKAWICKECGAFLGTTSAVTLRSQGKRGGGGMGQGMVRCRRCATLVEDGKSGDGGYRGDGGYKYSKSDIWEDGQGKKWFGGEETTMVAIPAVLKYLDVELAAMGIRLRFNIQP